MAIVAAWLFALAGGSANACDFDDAEGADVAVVFSGGGALTTTQVGALGVVQDLGVPIHCMVGTSMGSVTAALFAAGYDAQDIQAIYGEEDWSAIFRGGIDRKDKTYLQKEAEDEYFSDYVAGISRAGLALPGRFGDMGGLQAHFRTLFGHLPAELDFDRDLRIPFRSTAMDLATGEAVAFGSGDLVQTLLASMAVPGVFAPREIDERLYVDGGLAAQLPIAQAQAMGADVIIALDTTIPPSTLSGPQSIGSTTQQLLRIAVYRNWQDQVALMGPADVLIRPDLTGLNVGDFTNADIGFAAGRAEAGAHRDALLAIKAIAAPLRDRPLDPTAPFTPDGPLLVRNDTAISDAVIEDRFKPAQADLNDIAERQARLKDLIAFGGLGDADLAQAPAGPVLAVRGRSIGRNLLQTGLRASTTFDGDAQFSILGRVSRRPFSRTGGELSLSAELGTDFGATLELYQPFGSDGRFFAVPAVAFRGEEILFDLGDVRLGEFFQQQFDGRLRIGRELDRWGVIALEGILTVGRLEPQITLIEALSEPVTYEQAGVGAFFGVDTLDRGAWPTKGLSLQVNAQQLFDLADGIETDKFSVFFNKAFGWGPFGANLRLSAEAVEEDNDEPVEVLTLGGFRRISAFTEGSLPNDRYALATAEVFYRLTAADQIVSFPVYVGATAEYADVSFDIILPGETEDFIAGSVYLGANTVLGPTFFGLGFGEDAEFALFLHFGRAF
ncbi:MAG: patatin-like phospholipase family protein [Maricaulaceae bacterium]